MATENKTNGNGRTTIASVFGKKGNVVGKSKYKVTENGTKRTVRMGHVDAVKDKDKHYTTKEELGLAVKPSKDNNNKACYLLTVRGASAYAYKSEDGGIKLMKKEHNYTRVEERYSVDSAKLINSQYRTTDIEGFSYIVKFCKGYKYDDLKKYVVWEEKTKKETK